MAARDYDDILRHAANVEKHRARLRACGMSEREIDAYIERQLHDLAAELEYDPLADSSSNHTPLYKFAT